MNQNVDAACYWATASGCPGLTKPVPLSSSVKLFPMKCNRKMVQLLVQKARGGVQCVLTRMEMVQSCNVSWHSSCVVHHSQRSLNMFKQYGSTCVQWVCGSNDPNKSDLGTLLWNIRGSVLKFKVFLDAYGCLIKHRVVCNFHILN